MQYSLYLAAAALILSLRLLSLSSLSQVEKDRRSNLESEELLPHLVSDGLTLPAFLSVADGGIGLPFLP